MKRLITAVALLLAFAGAHAAPTNHPVTVGGYTTSGGGDYYGGGTDTPTYAFAPSTLTINVGDSVTFTNAGGINVAHNVQTDGNQVQNFRCANGCDGDPGGNGTPAFNEWSSTVTFTKAGVINYYCYNHKTMGMAGTITVNAVAATQKVVSGLSGNWDNPTTNQGGHGVQIEILPNNGILALWFVFNPAGNAQSWIYSQGSYDPASNVVSVPAFLETGGSFPPNFDASKLTVTPWGSLKFTFSDCTHGNVDWIGNDASHAAGFMDTSFPIQQLTKIPGTQCP